jgi:hypothetical protein
MIKSVLLSILFTFSIILNVQAQRLEVFSENKSQFLEELKTYMTASKRKVLEEIYANFAKQYKGGAFSVEEQDTILSFCNKMLQFKMTASPYFSNYLTGLTFVKKQQNGVQRLKEWHQVLYGLLGDIERRRLKPVKDYLAFSTQLFEHNALRYSKSGVSWISVADSFQLAYKDKIPQIQFKKLDLLAIRKNDSLWIKETNGIFYPLSNMWKGKKGQVNWERHGLTPDHFCDLTEYEIEVKNAIYNVKDATLHFPTFFQKDSIKGTFQDKLVASKQIKSFPRFTSNKDILEIDNLGAGIKFIGKFNLQGTSVLGSGNKANPANVMLFDKDEKLIFQEKSENFTIKKGELITANGVAIKLYSGQDSIVHPSVNLRFDIVKRIISFTRGKRGSDRNPYYTSFHQLNVDADKVIWYIDQDSITIGEKSIAVRKNKKEKTTFESLKYFSPAVYHRMQSIGSVNPISTLKIFADMEGSTSVDAGTYAKRLNPRFSIKSIEPLLYDMISKGFINYDKETEMIEVKDKVFHYADASRQKVDFDYLKIASESNDANAILDLKTKDMVITGVKGIELSKKQQVGAIPRGKAVILKENRDMDFDGKLFAAFGVFQGKDFAFDYDKFNIKMDSVRYFNLFVPVTGEEVVAEEPSEGAGQEQTGSAQSKSASKGQVPAKAIDSEIEYLTGVLLIDAPSNKSGKEDIAIFPSFQSKADSYVFYDRDSVYTRDSFYFKLKPFSFNSLDNFTEDDLNFKGSMYSSNIFPEFEETLVLKEDKSLGFNTETPAAGYAIYQNRGNYKGKIDLSNAGFKGEGTLSYLGAVINSEDIVFRPKSMTASAERFDLEEDRSKEIPQAVGLDVTITWKPYVDSMEVRTKTEPFDLYKEGDYKFAGLGILTPTGLKGSGLLNWEKASMSSKDFSFGAFSARSDTMDVKIKALEADALALETNNLSGFADFDQQKASFKANSELGQTFLPYNEYLTTMGEFDWDITGETITFKASKDQLASFTSTHKDKDSLTFDGKTALYDLKSSQLQIGGVPKIRSADAFIYPETGDIKILAGGQMEELTNAKIVADTLNKNHVINKVTISIDGRKDYSANGYYEYNIGDKEQEIYFSNITGSRVGKGKRSKKKTETRANGTIKPEDNFYIDTKTQFRGDISLFASNPALTLKGFARFDAPLMPDPQWFSLNSEGDKNNLVISYDVPKNYEGEQLRTGFFLSKENTRVYGRTMMPLFFRKDRPILPVTGVFKYDKAKDEFIFGDSTKVLNNQMRGSQLIFSNKTGKLSGEGPLNIGSGLKYISVKAAGKIETSFPNPKDSSTYDAPVLADMMAGIDIQIPDALLRIMVGDLVSSSFDAADIAYASKDDFYSKALAEFITNETEYIQTSNVMKNRTLFFPKKYKHHTFLFSDLPMKWDPDYQSFVSRKEKVGLAAIGQDAINKVLTCYVEFRMPSNGDDRCYIYIKSPSEYFYYFGYKGGILSTVSNNTRYNEAVEGLKSKETIIKMPDGETYEIQPINPGTARKFMSRVKATWRN